MAKLTKRELAFNELDWQEQREWREKALAEFDNEMFCPVCRQLLTGLHETTQHFQKYLNKVAAKIWKEALNGRN